MGGIFLKEGGREEGRKGRRVEGRERKKRRKRKREKGIGRRKEEGREGKEGGVVGEHCNTLGEKRNTQ